MRNLQVGQSEIWDLCLPAGFAEASEGMLSTQDLFPLIRGVGGHDKLLTWLFVSMIWLLILNSFLFLSF